MSKQDGSARRLILIVSSDPELLRERKTLLQEHDFAVITASNLLEVISACQKEFVAVILGNSLPAKEKSRIVATVRDACTSGTPIFALYEESVSEADNADKPIKADDPQALLRALNAI